MRALTALPSVRTVHSGRALVNIFRTVNAEQGDRLRVFVETHWGRRKGGMRGFCRAVGTTPETLYSWFRGETDPSMSSLAAIADALKVKRYEIVAVMDGEGVVAPVDAAALADRIQTIVDAALDSRGVPTVPRRSSRRSGAA